MRKTTLALICLALLTILVLSIAWNKLHYKKPNSEEDDPTITIGAIFDLTGSLSYMGQWSLEGAKLAESQINEEGGINGKPLRLLVEDAETNPQAAATIFQKYVSVYHLPVVIGFNGSSEVMAAAPIANKSKVILLSTGAASPDITKAGDFVFRNRLSGALEAAKMAQVAYKDLNLRRGMILYINTDYGQGYAEAFRSSFSKYGGAIIAEEAFLQDQTDFRAQISKIIESQPFDFVYLASHAREAGAILRQAKEQNVKVRWLASNAIEAPELFEIAGDSTDGVLLTVAQYSPTDPNAKAFNDRYKQLYNRDSEMFAAHAYDAVEILASTIKKYGTKPEDIRDALYQLKDYPGVSGSTTFDENGDVIKPVAIKLARNRKFELVDENHLQKQGRPN